MWGRAQPRTATAEAPHAPKSRNRVFGRALSVAAFVLLLSACSPAWVPATEAGYARWAGSFERSAVTFSEVALYFSDTGAPVEGVPEATARYDAAGEGQQDDGLEQAQAELSAERATRAIQASGQAVCDEWSEQGGGALSITILIHGFANTVDDARVSYRVFVEQLDPVLDSMAQRTLVIPVFWDATTSPTLSHWRRAQYTAPLVGLRLRAFINEFTRCRGAQSRPEVRLITHSSGAIIAASLVGDPSSTLPSARTSSRKYRNSPEYRWYMRHIASTEPVDPYRLPHGVTLDVASLAPAISSPAICALSDGQCSQEAPAFDRWVFQVRPRDRVLNQLVGLSRRLGATSLGARRGPSNLTSVQEHMVSSGWDCEVDFVAEPDSERSHAAVDYARSDEFAELVWRVYVAPPE